MTVHFVFLFSHLRNCVMTTELLITIKRYTENENIFIVETNIHDLLSFYPYKFNRNYKNPKMLVKGLTTYILNQNNY